MMFSTKKGLALNHSQISHIIFQFFKRFKEPPARVRRAASGSRATVWPPGLTYHRLTSSFKLENQPEAKQKSERAMAPSGPSLESPLI